MKKLLLLSIGAILYVLCFTGYVQASLDKLNFDSVEYEIIQVKPGDTLWRIADQYNDQFGVRLIKMVDIIYDFNQLESDKIFAGQVLKIPILTK